MRQPLRCFPIYDFSKARRKLFATIWFAENRKLLRQSMVSVRTPAVYLRSATPVEWAAGARLLGQLNTIDPAGHHDIRK
jgi:hypothetical protein